MKINLSIILRQTGGSNTSQPAANEMIHIIFIILRQGKIVNIFSPQ
ncbi:MAG: hypothetical protein PUD30_00030 [Muribaculaceae bacterium]|nr:hypothetical protein [Muribaculaceae bacterium]